MDSLPCGHVAHPAERRSCAHLPAAKSRSHYRQLTGTGMDHVLLCPACADGQEPLANVIEICPGCLELIDEEFDDVLGWRGQPEIRLRDGELTGAWTSRACAAEPLNPRCLAPLPDGWLALTAEGLVHLGESADRPVEARIELPTEEPAEFRGRVRGPALHTSRDGHFAAVVTDYGRYGTVLDLRTGQVVLPLDRNEYHPETTPFPFVFLDAGQVVAATDWCRLEVIDLGSGQSLAHHQLDYFRGALHRNPSGTRVADDGWVWGPVGSPRVLDVPAWLRGEEPDQRLSYRDHAWDQPVAWVDEDTVAVQRVGQLDWAMIDGVELYDARTAARTGMFAGPAGPMWGFGGLLHVSASAGFELWDPAQGARIGLIEGFRPHAHNPVTGAFAELADGVLRTLANIRSTPARP
ncbi:hypothetical protein N8J89_02380 [Crossiella sp. CA-258035]|uniref:hypothetical protein n=1 Tax=Crossiella sp. CA-258035 TaxID=2981138 RepID=UPI0024BD2CC9|nr:hypothetical protein [Crossiella sp. CA-258035]WHT19946.1 hypothetical protein N8J89_02380 [Crossiella sp. CA-258035]